MKTAERTPSILRASLGVHVKAIQKPKALQGLSSNNNLVIEASAGTGKTYTLEHLVLDLVIREQVAIEQILVVTFTEKAATELKLRLRRKLSQLLEDEEPEHFDISDSSDDSYWLIDQAEKNLLTTALLNFDRASICTIHSFCQKILHEHAFLQNRPFEQELVDSKTAFKNAFLEALRTNLACNPSYRPWLKSWLERQQGTFRQNGINDLLSLLAKCAELGGHIAPKLDESAIHRAIVEVTKAPSSPGVIKPMLAKAKLPKALLPEVLSKLALLRDILAKHTDRNSVPMYLSLMDNNPELIDDLHRILGTIKKPPPKLNHLYESIDILKKTTVPFKSAIAQTFLPCVLEHLRMDKSQNAQLDFDDMLTLVDEGLNKAQGFILQQTIQKRFQYALIDEFQDTDEVQWRIFRKLFFVPANNQGHHRIIIIGDPKQAIYAFRGADVQTYLSAKNTLLSNNSNHITLSQNWRSSSKLTTALNHLFLCQIPKANEIEPNEAEEKDVFFSSDIQYTRVEAGRETSVELIDPKLSQSAAVIMHPNWDSTPVSATQALQDFALGISLEIKRILLDDEIHLQDADGNKRYIKPQDIFILTRSAWEGDVVLNKLNEEGIQAILHQPHELFQTEEAAHIQILLHAIDEPHNIPACLQAWLTPFFAIPLDRLTNYLDPQPSKHEPYQRILSWNIWAKNRDYDQLFTKILDESGIIEREILFKNTPRRLNNYIHILEVLQVEARRSRPSLRELIHRLAAFRDKRQSPVTKGKLVERIEPNHEAVQIMSIHKSKGLEAEIVFILGGLDAPSSLHHPFHEEHERKIYIGDQIPDAAQYEAQEEDKRLLYVALTRAKSRLYVPYIGEGSDGQPTVNNLTGLQRLLEPHLTRVSKTNIWSVLTIDTENKGKKSKRMDPQTIKNWSPKPQWFAPIHTPDTLVELRETKKGPQITSYSRLKSSQTKHISFQQIESLDKLGEPQSQISYDSKPTRFPGGAASGRFLHEILEKISPEVVRDAPSIEFLAARKDIIALFEESMIRYQRPTQLRNHAIELIYNAFKTPLLLKDTTINGLCTAKQLVREMQFLYKADTTKSQTYIKGFIDVVFEHEGRVYVLDWKSDDLPLYTYKSINKYIKQNYQLQAEIYSEAVLRLMEIQNEDDYEARFGGVCYAFLRGLNPKKTTHGQWFWRPTYQEIIDLSKNRQIDTPKIESTSRSPKPQKLPNGPTSSIELNTTGTAYTQHKRLLEAYSETSAVQDPLHEAVKLLELSSEHIYLAQELASLAPSEHRESITHLAFLALSDVTHGNTATLIDEQTLKTRLQMLYGVDDYETKLQNIISLINDIHNARPVLGIEDTPLVIENNKLYLGRMHRLEHSICDLILNRLKTNSTKKYEKDLSTVLEEVLSTAPVTLTDEQLSAVEKSAISPITVITGGPGTGKTSIVVTLLRVLTRLKIPTGVMALCAPTGKASHRLNESIMQSLKQIQNPSAEDIELLENPPLAVTVHRLLGARPNELVAKKDNPIHSQVIIVDESSMMNLELMTRLLGALTPNAQLILLGDAHQLPSIEAGTVLSDLLDSLPNQYTCKLTKSFRMRADNPNGRSVLQSAQAINAADETKLFSTLERCHNPKELTWSGAEFAEVDDKADLANFLDEWFLKTALGQTTYRKAALEPRIYSPTDKFSEQDVKKLNTMFNKIAENQLLTVTRKSNFPTSSETLCEAIYRRYARALKVAPDGEFLAGEPVMMLKNDHTRKLYNGDIGLVIFVTRGKEKSPHVVFQRGPNFEAFALELLAQDLTRAHAMTVHKAQGSEFQRVAVMLPFQYLPILSKEVVYTAATRAKQSVLFVGSEEILKKSLNAPIQRTSGLIDRIKNHYKTKNKVASDKRLLGEMQIA